MKPIIDIRAVNYGRWETVEDEHGQVKQFVIVRHTLQTLREGEDWKSIKVIEEEMK